MYPLGTPKYLSKNIPASEDWASTSSSNSSSTHPHYYSHQPSPPLCPTRHGDNENAFPMSVDCQVQGDLGLENLPTMAYDHPMLDMCFNEFLTFTSEGPLKESAFELQEQSTIPLAGRDLDFSEFMEPLEVLY